MIDGLPLTKSDRKTLAQSFISEELAEEVTRVSDYEGALYVGKDRNAAADYAGLMFPIYAPESSSPREYRLRLDNPEMERKSDGKLKPKMKYLSPPGKTNMLNFGKNCSTADLTDTKLDIVITEGCKQFLAMLRTSRHGLTEAKDVPRFLILGIHGVWGFRGTVEKIRTKNDKAQNVKGAIEDLNFVEWNGRKVTLIYDLDAKTNSQVRAALHAFAKELADRGTNVHIADCPQMEDCSGIDDVLGKIETEKGTDVAVKKCLEILEAAKPFKPEKVSQANQILSLADDIEFFHTTDRAPYASIEVGGHKEVHSVHSKSFRDYLSYQFYQTDGKSPSSQVLQDAINSLSGKAKFEGKTQDVHIRLASFSGKIYLDLCNDEWQIIEIDAEGCRVIEAKDAPVRFKRTKAMLPLLVPTGCGDISKLKNFLNVDEKNFVLILSWLVNCFRPDYPFPILLITGEQGTAKSTASKVCRELVDPNIAPFRSAPRDDRDLIIAAVNAWVCAFDNLSAVPNSLSDGFCRISTGGSLATRTLYSDDEETIFTAKRPIILNGIGDIASRSDLLDRALLIKLEAIPKDKRKPEREFWTEFEKEKTSIFSALIHAVGSALKNIENVKLAELPRMADFAQWATAAERALELEENAFMNAYTENREDAHSIVLEDSPVFEAIQKICGDRTEFDGTMKEFLGLIDTLSDDKT